MAHFRLDRFRLALPFALALFAAPFAGCGGGGSDPPAGGDGGSDGGVDPLVALQTYYPTLSATGGPQVVTARQITDATKAADLIDGEARSGLVGDYVLKNDKIHLVIQAPGRSIGPAPYGGNIIDADLVRTSTDPFVDPDDDTTDGAGNDQFGELSPVYLAGRTFVVDTAEVVRDGSAGGAAVIRMIGHTGVNDYIHLKGLGFSPPNDFNPDYDDSLKVAITYILEPGSTTCEIHWSMYNPGEYAIRGPIGVLSDSGGETQLFGDGRGFERAGLDNIASLEGSVRYSVFQAPGIAYGILPTNLPAGKDQVSSLLVQGVGVTLFGVTAFLDILDETKGEVLRIEPNAGVRYAIDFMVGRDAAALEASRLTKYARPNGTLTGNVTIANLAPSAITEIGKLRPRVALFTESDGTAGFSATDRIETYTDVGDTGAFTINITPGTYYLVADLGQVSRSTATTVTITAGQTATQNVNLTRPSTYDYEVVETGTTTKIPAKLTVVGVRSVPFDVRFGEDYDVRFGVVTLIHSRWGDSTGQGGDKKIILPAGGTYRVFVTRGPEWSYATADLTNTASGLQTKQNFSLTRVLDTAGYISADFHQHATRSPDSPVGLLDRVRTHVSEGLEFFASTEHDYIVDYEPLIQKLSAQSLVDSIPGVEATPFDWGHFNIWPLTQDPAHPAMGAVDWGGGEGLNLVPGDMFAAYRTTRGAEVVQINHPRAGGSLDFQQYFDRAALKFDFVAKTYAGVAAEQPYPNALLRLPEDKSLFSSNFDTLEVWNGFNEGDPDADGVREYTRTDKVLRDFMSFYSMGKIITPTGNSDTHSSVKDPTGMPRTYVAVPSDNSAAITGGLKDAVDATLLGRQGSFRDVVVSNGPFLRVTNSGGQPAIGRLLPATGGNVTISIQVQSPAWMGLDTLEVLGGDPPPDEVMNKTAIVPLACFTSRSGRMPTDICDRARIGGARALNVTTTGTGAAAKLTATHSITLPVADVNVSTSRRGTPVSPDFILFVRASSQKGTVFPIMNDSIFTTTNPSLLTSVTTAPANTLSTVLAGKGPFPMAFSAPIFVDADGDGVWRAPYATP